MDYAMLRRDPENQQLNHPLLDLVPTDGGRVLDIGCGDGAVSEQLLDRDPAMTLVGVDPDEKLLAEAAARLGGRAGFVPGDAAAVAVLFPTASFDTVVLANCIHLVDPLAEALDAVATVLAPGGTLVFNSAFYSGAEHPADLGVYAELVGAARATALRRGFTLDRTAVARPPGLRRTADDYAAALADAGEFTGIVITKRSFQFGPRFIGALSATPMFAAAALPGIDTRSAAELLAETVGQHLARTPVAITRTCLYGTATRR